MTEGLLQTIGVVLLSSIITAAGALALLVIYEILKRAWQSFFGTIEDGKPQPE